MKENKRSLGGLLGTKPKVIDPNKMVEPELTYLQFSAGTIPCFLGHNKIELPKWLKKNHSDVLEMYHQYGAVLFRGFFVENDTAFSDCAATFTEEMMEYTEPSTPRTRVGSKLYTSTEYPKEQFIPMHNEHSYSNNWPEKLWLYCAEEPEKGGQTPLADSKLIYSRLSEKLRNTFEEKGIMYVRNFSPGLDIPWQQVYETENKSEVETMLLKKNIQFEWKSDDHLCTRQRGEVSLNHPRTGDRVWFNQTNLFHISCVDEPIRNYLIENYGIENVPRNVYFGDGEEIPTEFVDEIREVYEQHLIVFDWRKSDVVLVDNMRYAHGRMPFDGKRRILVAMSDPIIAENKTTDKTKDITSTRKNTASFFINKTANDLSEEVLKYKLAVAYRIMVMEGLDEGGISGHISVKVPGKADRFWVNPFGLMCEEVTPDNLILVDSHGNVLEGDYPVNVAGFCIHEAIHRNHSDVMCAAHTHSPWGTLFSGMNQLIKPIDQNCCMFFEKHALYDQFNGPVTDAEDAARISAKIAGKDAIILRNHGTITCGSTIESAVVRMVAIERAYRLNVLASQIGLNEEIDPDTARMTAAWIGNDLGLSIEFNALMRKAERVYPDLKQYSPFN